MKKTIQKSLFIVGFIFVLFFPYSCSMEDHPCEQLRMARDAFKTAVAANEGNVKRIEGLIEETNGSIKKLEGELAILVAAKASCDQNSGPNNPFCIQLGVDIAAKEAEIKALKDSLPGLNEDLKNAQTALEASKVALKAAEEALQKCLDGK